MKDLTAKTVETFELPEGSTGAAVLDLIVKRHPSIAEFVPFLRLATEEAYISASTTLIHGSEISIIPPVSGG